MSEHPNIPATPQPSTPPWRGINHLASSPPTWTRPCASTTACSAPGWSRRSARRRSGTTSSSSARDTVAFFEYARPRASSRSRSRRACPIRAPSSSTTCRSTCPTRRRCSTCATGSRAHDCEVTDVVDHGFIRSIYFTDPNGIALEASWWVLDATGRRPTTATTALFADPDPVPAVRELRESGELASVPATHLV